MDNLKLKAELVDSIRENLNELAALNDDLADHPEVSGQEFRSSKRIVDLLTSKGFSVQYPYAGYSTAFLGIYGKNDHSHKVAILTEYDALPDIGHACGHCLSASISVLAALALKELQDALDADIHVLGTPMEETSGAKCGMIEQGIFGSYDMAIMVHLYDSNLVAPKLQAIACYEYIFHGKAAHASTAPWEGINALNSVQLFYHALDMMRQHVRPDAQFHGIIRDGGKAPNVVPERASAEFFIRALDREYLKQLIGIVDRCAEGAAIATGATWEKRPTAPVYEDWKHNKTGETVLADVFTELGLPLNGDPQKIFGSSDAGNVSHVCPTFHPCLQVSDQGVDIHTEAFAACMKTPRAHQSLEQGAKLISFFVAKIFSRDVILHQMKLDFKTN